MKQETLVYCTWFAGGLRIVDLAQPDAPREVAHFIPEPARGRAGPLTNDVDMDDRGIIYLVDRGPRFDRGDRGERGPRQEQPASGSASEHGAVQPAPDALPHPARGGSPILPPLASPHQQPSWKQEQRGSGTGEGGEKKE